MDIQNDDNEDARNLLAMKKRGFKRHSPQIESTPTKAGGQKVEKMHTCIDCSFTGLNEMQLITHIASKHKAARPNGKNKTDKGEFNCQECDFQGTTEIQVRKHYNLKHTMRGSDCQEPIKCKICGDEFTEKWNLMMHRKTNHIGSVATCRNFENEICSYTSDACWWNHEEKRNCSANIQCYICGKSFEKKSDLMSHRKKNHIDLVQQCNKFINAECRFQSEFCWYKHSQDNKKPEIAKDEVILDEENSFFQEEIKNPKPPSVMKTDKDKTKNNENQ